MGSAITVVTADLLREHDACEGQVTRFERIFPEGLPATQEGLIRALDGGFAEYAWTWSQQLGLGISLHHADLRYADLHHADLRYADLHHADLRYADLRYADLSDADLRYADLSDADLREADLRGANLSEASLYGAGLRHADLRGARGVPDWVRDVEEVRV